MIWRVRVHALLLIAALLVGSLAMGARQYSLAHSIAAQLIKQRSAISFYAEVRSDPTLTSPRVVGNNRRSPEESFLVVSSEVSTGSQRFRSHLPFRVVSAQRLQLIPGDRIYAHGNLLSTQERKVAGLIVIKGEIVLAHRAPIAQRIASHIRFNFARESARIHGSAGALIPGLVLGDTSLESPTLIAQMRRTGLTHLTAVSGENFAIISTFLLSYLSWLIRSLRGRLVVTACVLAAFILIVRPSPSVLRAAVMSGVLLVAHARGERRRALPSLGLAIALLIVINPFLAIDPGFALSVSATAGILLLNKPLDHFFSRWINAEKIRELLVIPCAATLLCLPIIVGISGQISPLSIPANILASLAVAPVTIVGFLAALMSSISSPLAHLILVLLGPISGWISWIAAHCARFPVLMVPHSYWGAGLIVIALLLRKFWRRLVLILAITLLAISWVNSSWPGENWLVAICDIGQGDGYAISLFPHQALVIDSGPDPQMMDSCLKHLGITQIPLLILTHFHADHVGGLSGVLHDRTVGSYWISTDHQPIMEYQSSVSALSPLVPTEVSAGQNFTIASRYGPVQIEILSPTPVLHSGQAHQSGSEINNSSIAAMIVIDGVRIFATGDIEPAAQAELLAHYQGGPVEILKVAHHGSSHQDPELERALRPKIALVSVGLGNPYGHPSLATITRLTGLGARVFRTDLDGAISVDPSLRIRTLKRDRWKLSWG
jgi:competence protein ComEC